MNDPTSGLDNVSVLRGDQLSPTGFLRDTSGLYRQNVGLFLRIIAPAVVLSYLAVYATSTRAEAIVELAFKKGAWDSTMISEVAVLRFSGLIASWMLYSFAFGAICCAMQRLSRGEEISADDAYAETRESIGRLMRVSSCLFLIFGAGFLLISFISVMVLIRIPAVPTEHLITLISYLTYLGFAVAFSRLVLAFPAVLLDGKNVGESLFLSDELTDGRNWLLLVLLAKSLLGSYIAVQVPFFAASWILENSTWPIWLSPLLLVIGMAAGAVLQSQLFVAFAHLYQLAKSTPLHFVNTT